MNDDIAIKVEHVSKTFRLPHEKQNSLKGSLINMVRGGKRTYERQRALQSISFDIHKGEFFGIIGRNGSGKSTLLKLLAGIYSPSEGSIFINGKLTPFIELGVGFNPELTGRENVYLNGALLGFSRKEMEAMYPEIVEFAELDRFMDQKLKNYSSGMQVRLAFSIAIRARTEILLVDEVLAVGDQTFQEKCFSYFEEIKKTGKTVVLISHDGSVIERFCSRVAIIDRGKLVDVGGSREMVLAYGAILAGEQFKEPAQGGKIIRQGTGALRIHNPKLLNNEGKKAHIINFGEPFSINSYIKRQNKNTKENVIIGVDIIDQQGVSVLGPNTKEAIKNPLIIDDDVNFNARFLTNPLSPGTYKVTIGIFNEKASFAHDLVEDAVMFKIIGEARHGKIYVEPEWAIVRNSK